MPSGEHPFVQPPGVECTCKRVSVNSDSTRYPVRGRSGRETPARWCTRGGGFRGESCETGAAARGAPKTPRGTPQCWWRAPDVGVVVVGPGPLRGLPPLGGGVRLGLGVDDAGQLGHGLGQRVASPQLQRAGGHLEHATGRPAFRCPS